MTPPSVHDGGRKREYPAGRCRRNQSRAAGRCRPVREVNAMFIPFGEVWSSGHDNPNAGLIILSVLVIATWIGWSIRAYRKK